MQLAATINHIHIHIHDVSSLSLKKSESRFQFYSRMQNLRSVDDQPLEQDDENQPELPAQVRQVRAELLEQGGDGEALRQGPPGPGEGQLQL